MVNLSCRINSFSCPILGAFVDVELCEDVSGRRCRHFDPWRQRCAAPAGEPDASDLTPPRGAPLPPAINHREAKRARAWRSHDPRESGDGPDEGRLSRSDRRLPGKPVNSGAGSDDARSLM